MGNPIILSKKMFEEELIIFDTKRKYDEKIRDEKSKIEQKYLAIIEGIKHLNEILGKNQRYVIGLSGGIDSSVVACLMVKAIGKENVIGINMPSKFNSDKTKNIASDLAKKLGIKYHSIDIDAISELNSKLIIEGLQINELKPIVRENIQAKIRGTNILSNIASQIDGLFTCNGNKIEIATGYSTLYGDLGGAIAPIGDLTKEEVFELARFLNEKIFCDKIIDEDLLPDEIFQFDVPPTAELKDKQIDPFKWGYHDKIIEKLFDYKKVGKKQIVEWYDNGIIEDKLNLKKGILARWNINSREEFLDDLEWLTDKISKNVFKRVQSPPIIVVSKSAFGFDIRESII
jgi:NAD+ synthase (glutamine-hydrolysing)